jgi:hypothetical protein
MSENNSIALFFGASLASVTASANRNNRLEKTCECVQQDQKNIYNLYTVTYDTERGIELSRRYIKGFSGSWALELCENEAQKDYLCR